MNQQVQQKFSKTFQIFLSKKSDEVLGPDPVLQAQDTVVDTDLNPAKLWIHNTAEKYPYLKAFLFNTHLQEINSWNVNTMHAWG